jgi:uncharacterized membrane protein YadS
MSLDARIDARRRQMAALWPLAAAAIASVVIVPRTPLRVLGPLTVALLVGMALRSLPSVRAIPRPAVVWLSREVLRAGVVLVGVRLDWVLLARAGAGPLVIALTAVIVGLALFAVLVKLLGVPRRLGSLLAIGSSVCGAAAITAASPVVGAKDDEANVGIAIVSVLGALASLVLVIAHGMVALATVTKLARVALLPVALVAMPWLAGAEARGTRARFRLPPLVVWFLVASAIATMLSHAGLPAPLVTGWMAATKLIAQLATILLASSMVAIGALVDWRALARAGARPIAMAIIGALLLFAVVIAVAARGL